jgi:D-arabinose 1-dehydrogenase
MFSFELPGYLCDTVSMLSIQVGHSRMNYGCANFRSAPHYHPSEIVLGKALKALRKEFPRESYQIITKTGKYSPFLKDHDLSENMTRLCVERSLKRFETDYLDVVCGYFRQGTGVRLTML